MRKPEVDSITKDHNFLAANEKGVANMEEDALHYQKGKKRKRRSKEVGSDLAHDNTNIQISDSYKVVFNEEIMKRGKHPENCKLKKKKKEDRIEPSCENKVVLNEITKMGKHPENCKLKKKKKVDKIEPSCEENTETVESKRDKIIKKNKKNREDDVKALNEENTEAEENEEEDLNKNKKEKQKKKKKEKEDKIEPCCEENTETVESKQDKRKKKNKKNREDDLKALNEDNIEAEENEEEDWNKNKKEKLKKKKKNKEDKLVSGCEEDIEAVERKEEKRKKKNKKNREDELRALHGEENIVAEETEEMKKKKEMKDDLKALNEKEKKGDINVGHSKGQSVGKKNREVDLKALNEGNIDLEETKEKKKMKDYLKAPLNEKGTEGDTAAGNVVGPSVENKQKKEDQARDEMKASTKILGQKTGVAVASKPKRTTNTAHNEKGDKLATPKSQCKKVKFSSQVEVFHIPVNGSFNSDEKINETNMVLGKRYTKEEDEILRQAILDYVKRHRLGADGVDMVMNSKSHKQVRGCWREIGKAIPYRPPRSISFRAHNIFNRSEKRGWSKEEHDLLKELHAKYGSDWTTAAKELGKFRIHVKDAYRRTRMANRKRGHWSQEEYQTLFDLVNVNLEVKAYEEKNSKYGMLRDNIGWTAISVDLGTRNDASCCNKWYHNLSSSMVNEGTWADADDYRLLIELYNLDASCEEEVEWDFLIEDRPGDVCRRRWQQMARHIGEHRLKSFAEQVEVLSKRYCPRMLEIREKLDSRPVVN